MFSSKENKPQKERIIKMMGLENKTKIKEELTMEELELVTGGVDMDAAVRHLV